MYTHRQTLDTFGRVWIASGAGGTFSKWEYRLNFLTCFAGATHLGTTFVAKTVTAYPNLGNTKLKKDGFSPKRWIPETVYCNPRLWWKGACLNCFGLSNDGLDTALRKGKWQNRRKPFMLSFMPVGEKHTWIEQTKYLVYILKKELPFFRTIIGLQFNASCPNTGTDPLELAPFMKQILDILAELGIPIYVKINVQFPIPLAKEVSKHPACAGLIMGNTLPFGAKLPDGWPQVPWVDLLGTDDPMKSPLARKLAESEGEGVPGCIIDPKKAGGLSGAPLLPIVCYWIGRARDTGIRCHINAGGGILSPSGVNAVVLAGANSVSLGTMDKFRPWMMLPTTLFAKVAF
jgi:dihydroorotate dehydrogenase